MLIEIPGVAETTLVTAPITASVASRTVATSGT